SSRLLVVALLVILTTRGGRAGRGSCQLPAGRRTAAGASADRSAALYSRHHRVDGVPVRPRRAVHRRARRRFPGLPSRWSRTAVDRLLHIAPAVGGGLGMAPDDRHTHLL